MRERSITMWMSEDEYQWVKQQAGFASPTQWLTGTIRQKIIKTDKVSQVARKRRSDPQVREYWDRCFEAFWQAWPRTDGKKEARAAWERLMPQDLESAKHLAVQVEARLSRYLVEQKNSEKRFIPHASTWLRREEFVS